MATEQLIFIALTIACFVFALRNTFQLIFRTGDDAQHKKRFKELDFNGQRIGQSKDSELKNFIEKTTSPLLEIISPRLKPKTIKKLQRELEFVGWDKYFQAEQFKMLQFFLMIAGILLGILLYNVIHPLFGVVVIAAGFILPAFLLKNEVTNKRERVFNEFPEFIQLVQGYLTANLPLTEAIQSTIEYVGPEWQEYLTEFVVNSKIHSLDDALDKLQYKVNIPEVSELLN